MNIIDCLLSIKDDGKACEPIIYETDSDERGDRYYFGSIFIGLLAEYALNKEKNKCKPDFEDLFPCDIMQILLSEIRELEHEVIQDKRDPRRILEEVADCAASIVGLIVNLRDSLKDK